MSLSVSQALCFFGNYEIFVFLVCQWISLRWSLHHLLCLSCSESATLDLVAVLGRVEVLHHLLVLLRHEWLSKPENGNPIRKLIRKLSRWKKIDTGDSCGSLLSSKLGGNVVRGSGGRPMGWCRPFINTVRRKTIVIHSDWTRNLIAWSWVLTFNTERVQEEENKTEINRQGVVALSEVGKKCRRRWKGIWKHRIIFEERVIIRIIAITAMLSKERKTRTVQIVEGCFER